MNVTHLFVPSELSEHPLHLPELRAGKTVVTERQVRTKDGSIRIAEVSARLLPDGRIQAIARDITERKRDAIAQRFLAEASRLLASSLDYETTLASGPPGRARPRWCFVYIFDSGLERTEVATADPADEALAKKLVGFPPPTLKAVCEALPDLCAGEAHLFESVHPDVLAAIARSPEHLEQMRALGAHSAMLVPMEVRGRVLGAINIVSTRSARRYTHRDLTQAMELGRRAAWPSRTRASIVRHRMPTAPGSLHHGYFARVAQPPRPDPGRRRYAAPCDRGWAVAPHPRDHRPQRPPAGAPGQ